MYQNKKVLAMIPARGGSKGLPGKNIKELCGKPVIAWSIDAAKSSKYVDTLMVSTDNDEIANISRAYGADVPFMRPDYLASDTATSYDAIEHTLDYYKNGYDYLVLLEPTSPLRTSEDIDKAIEQLFSSDADSIVGISKTEDQNPAFLIKLNSDNFIIGYEDEKMTVKRRQEIENVYFFEGTVYISDINTLREKKSFYHDTTIGYEVPKYKSLEIDDIYDFVMVEAIMKHKGYKA